MSHTLFSQRTEKSKLKIVYEMKQLESFFKISFDLDLYLIYGTLLGAVREGDFIAHDYDVDFAYLSKFTISEEIIQEFQNICYILQKNHLLIKSKSNKHIHCKCLSDKFVFDIWASWIKNNSYHLAPTNLSFNPMNIMPLREINFKNSIFKIPNNSETVLNTLYYNWKIPVMENFRKFKY